METVCRSPQQIEDDEACEAHTEVVSMLNEMSCGYCLYTGKRRAALVSLRKQLEAQIDGSGPIVDFVHRRIYAAITL